MQDIQVINGTNNSALLYKVAQDMGIPEDAWTQQNMLMDEGVLLRLQGQISRIPMYRFRASASEKGSIVCMIGEWDEKYKKGERNEEMRYLCYAWNYMVRQCMIPIRRSKETGKLVAIFNGPHTTWDTLKIALEISPEHIPMIKPTPERLVKHKIRQQKSKRILRTPPVSDDESEDSYNS